MDNLNIIIQEFKIPAGNYSFKTISNGMINDTYLVSDNNNPSYILQRLNTKIFTNFKSIINNLDLVLPLLKSDDYSEVILCKSKKGESFISVGTDEIWRLMTFIKNSVVHNTTNSTKIAFEAGRIIGQFHKLLQDFNVEKLQDTLPQFHDINLRYNQFKLALKNAKAENIKNAQKAINFVKENINFLTEVNYNELPLRVCHNDTKLNNILFSNDNKALCLIDLDTIMKGYLMYDFGDAIRTIVNSAPEDEKDLSKINFNIELFDSFIKGMALDADFLTDEEKKKLSYGVVLMPFLHGIRALTDYLENNRYYKVSYETQNLDRCFSLFQFAKLSIQNIDKMNEFIENSLN